MSALGLQTRSSSAGKLILPPHAYASSSRFSLRKTLIAIGASTTAFASNWSDEIGLESDGHISQLCNRVNKPEMHKSVTHVGLATHRRAVSILKR